MAKTFTHKGSDRLVSYKEYVKQSQLDRRVNPEEINLTINPTDGSGSIIDMNIEMLKENIRNYIKTNVFYVSPYTFSEIIDCGMEDNHFEQLTEQMTEEGVFTEKYYLTYVGDKFDLMILNGKKSDDRTSDITNNNIGGHLNG
jgi:hypothetical protein